MKTNENKILLINTQFVERYVSGFTNRFIGLWCYLQKNTQAGGKIHWITNKSLWNKYFKGQPKPDDITILNADLRYFKFTSRLFYPFYILYKYYKERCTSVHVATSIIDPIYLVRLFNFFRIPYCFTFASNSLEMASYNDERAKKKWQKLFSLAHNIDVLNPTNSIEKKNGKKFTSPSSFPYITEFTEIPQELFTRKERTDTVVFCGTFVSQKNPFLAIEGFRNFFERYSDLHPDAQLIMIGRGGLKSEIEEKITSVNASFGREIIKLFPDDKMIETLSSAKVFLSLQDYDNYPSQSLMEAMLFCNSVIATNNGDTARLVDVSKKNILLSEKDPVQLGSAIEELLKDWKLNLENKALIDEKFSTGIFAKYFLNIHHEISKNSS